MSGIEEVESFFADANRRMEGRLHTTLVALGVSRETGLENVVDRVIPVSDEELGDAAGVAKRIGTYVASCLRERRRASDGPVETRRLRKSRKGRTSTEEDEQKLVKEDRG